MKMPIRLILASLAAAIALPITASAAKADRKKKDSPETTFATIDKDGNGVVTPEEYVGLMGKTLGETAAKARFDELDKDKNGKLTKEEFAASGSGEKKKRKKKNQE